MELIGTLLNDRYKIADELGEGGMATVYRAIDNRLQREVAIKILHPHLAKDVELCQRFQQEASIAAKLEHENIVKIYDFGLHTDGRAFIVSELIRGENYHVMQTERFKKESKPFDPLFCAMVCEEVCKALLAAHTLKYVHRDVKPDNIMINDDGWVKLTDFGIAKNVGTSITLVGHFLGSPSYSSPEQVQGKQVDFRSDIFSLGVILYESITGRLPFNGNSASEVMIKICQGQYTPIGKVKNNLAPELENIITKSLNTLKEDRFNSTESVLESLRSFLAVHEIYNSRAGIESYLNDPDQFLKAHAKTQRRVALAQPEEIENKNQEIRISDPEIKTVEKKLAEKAEISLEISKQNIKKINAEPEKEIKKDSPKEIAADFRTTRNVKPNKNNMARQDYGRNTLNSTPRTQQNSTFPWLLIFSITAVAAIFLLIMINVNSNREKQSQREEANTKRTESAKIAAVAKQKTNKTESAMRSESRPEIKAEFRSEPKSEPKYEPRQEQKIEKQEAKPEFRAEPKPEPKREARQEAKPETRPEIKIEPKTRRENAAPLQNSVSVPPPNISPPKQETPDTTKFTVTTIPMGAPLFIDEARAIEFSKQGAIRTFDIKPGPHIVTLKRFEYLGVKYGEISKKIFVEPGRTLNIGLLKMLPIRTLSVFIGGPGVIARINGDPYPMTGKAVVLNLPEGKVDVEARATNGRTLRRIIDLKGDNFSLNTSLE